jgi:hypothetical protein
MAYRYFGDVPAVIPQEVRASPPSPSQANVPPPAPSAQQLVRRRPVRASPLLPPGTIQAGLMANSRMPVAAVLQGMHVGSTIIPRATNINGAPVMVSEVERPGSLGNMNIDTSVSARHRAQQKLGALIADGSPVSGNYTDAIRNAAGFAFGPKRMPRQGYSAASYSYPAQQMVIGATLAGTPIVNAAPVPASPMSAPRLVTRAGGQGPRGQINSSPSEARRRLISTLQGIGASPSTVFDAAGWDVNIKTFFDSAADNVPPDARDTIRAITSNITSLPYVPWDYISKNIGASKLGVGPLSIDLPPAFREAFVRWAYKMLWGAEPSPAKLAAGIRASRNVNNRAELFVSALNIANYLKSPFFDPGAKDPIAAKPELAAIYKSVLGCEISATRLEEWWSVLPIWMGQQTPATPEQFSKFLVENRADESKKGCSTPPATPPGGGGGGGGGGGTPGTTPGVKCKMEGSGFRIRLVCRDAAGNVVPGTPPPGGGGGGRTPGGGAAQPPSEEGMGTGAKVGIGVALALSLALVLSRK